MPALVGIKRRYSDQSMDPGFTFQKAERVRSLDQGSNVLYACLFAGQLVDRIYRKTFTFSPLNIHPEEHRCPVTGLCSASAGIDGEEGVAAIGLFT